MDIGRTHWVLYKLARALINLVRGFLVFIFCPEQVGLPPQTIKISSSVRALVIGINKYKYAGGDLKDLGGCVADALDMYTYLTKTRGMSPDSVIYLHDENATRARILEGIRALRDSSTPPGDPIIIFWAGHGCHGPAPLGWKTSNPDGKIEILIPHDFDPKAEGEGVSGLLDYQFGCELSELTKEKGDNIIVILDTCHAGSATRDQDYVVRGFKLLTVPIPAVDKTSARGHNRAMTGSWHSDRTAPDSASHILLAGTSSSSCAYEKDGRGVFTRALLNFLRTHESPEQLTYSDVIHGLPPLDHGQTPQCEGRNADRHIFSLSVPNWGYRCHLLAEHAILRAGGAQGITKGALFDLHTSRDPNALPVLCRMRAEDVTPVQTTLRFPSDLPANLTLPSEGWARQTSTGENLAQVSVALGSAGDVPDDILEDLEQDRPGYFSLASTGNRDHQILVTKNIEGRLVFDLTDETCRAAGLQRLRQTVPSDSDRLRDILVSVGDFFECLRRSRPKHPFQRYVSVEAHLLEDDEDDECLPIGNNLISDGTLTPEHVYEHDAIGDHRCYGFTIKNNYSQSLYFWIFMFNMNDLSIDEIYRPVLANRNSDYCVQPGCELTIGYGNGGVLPQSFFLPPGEDTVVGYLKTFVSPSRMDLSHIKRPSALIFKRNLRNGKMSKDERWDTLQFPIIQKRS